MHIDTVKTVVFIKNTGIYFLYDGFDQIYIPDPGKTATR